MGQMVNYICKMSWLVMKIIGVKELKVDNYSDIKQRNRVGKTYFALNEGHQFLLRP